MKLATKPNPPPKRSNKRAIDTDRLDEMLGQLESEHTNLLNLALAHKDALTHASVEELNTITTRTSAVLVRIAEIEDTRRRMIANEHGSLASLDELMTHFDADDRDRISKRQSTLRELIARIKQEQEEVRVASEQLANHMRGLIKQVGASLSHAGTYSRGGAVDPSRSQVMSSLDVVQ
jgi:hypothetical protein